MGLDTPVVHAVNYGYWTLAVSTLSVSFNKVNTLSTPPGEYERKLKTQRNRREPAQAVEHVVQFDNKRGTLPRLDILGICQKRRSAFGNPETGAAWLSSARVVRCTVKSGNERNPHSVLQVSQKTAQPLARCAR